MPSTPKDPVVLKTSAEKTAAEKTAGMQAVAKRNTIFQHSEGSDITVWYLEGLVEDSTRIWKTTITNSPFKVGRSPASDLTLNSRQVSQSHAELLQRGDSLWLRDLKSTNGTFVNRKRVLGEQMLADGDSISFADQQFQLVQATREHSRALMTKTLDLRLNDLLTGGKILRAHEFHEMLKQETLHPLFQPMVHLRDGSIFAYEALGRVTLGGVEALPSEFFPLAEGLSLADRLSTLLRLAALAEGSKIPGGPLLFVNTHPSELDKPEIMLASLTDLRQRYPETSIVLEIHEAAVTNLLALRQLSADLSALRIGIAFDDFGTGQARLLELIDIAPHFLKFDRAWVKGLNVATSRRREMVSTLVKLVLEMGSSPLAEGVETADEAKACEDIGFQYAQGYHFGYPLPIADVLKANKG
jgi:EAL domain-containing protein (putative c-di-GMP-specific phosphodiesterase class I)